MPFVVTEACINCKHTDCVDVCPMDCFLEGPNFLVIDPVECIDCSMCVPECPVDAIVEACDLTDEQLPYAELNARLSQDPRWKPLTRSKPALPGHAQWAQVKDKRNALILP
ncbi:MAG: hypothetical protein RLZZ618_1126 [Pseudomonadota bacterium]